MKRLSYILTTIAVSIALCACLTTKRDRRGASALTDKNIGPKPKTIESPIEANSRLARMETAASIVLKTEDWVNVSATRPNSTGTVLLSQIDSLIQRSGVQDRKLAVVEIPSASIIDPNQKTGDQTAIDIKESLEKAGFVRVVFLTFRDGVLAEVYPNGTPTREEAEHRKQMMLKTISTINNH